MVISNDNETTSTNYIDELEEVSIETDPVTKYVTKVYREKSEKHYDTTNISKMIISFDALDDVNNIRNDNDYNSNILDYTFVDPIYLGYIDSSIDDITIDVINSSFKKEIITDSNSISWNYNVDDVRMMILYPVEKGELMSIKDINGIELINSFTTQDIVYNNIEYKLTLFNNIIYNSRGTLVCKFEKE